MAPRKSSTDAAAKKTAGKAVEEKSSETAQTVEKKAAGKTAAVKAEAKETAEKTTRTRRKKAEANTEVYIQFWGKEVYAKDVVADIKKIWTDEMGKKAEDLTDLKVYIKPEDDGAHYVINGEITGFIRL